MKIPLRDLTLTDFIKEGRRQLAEQSNHVATEALERLEEFRIKWTSIKPTEPGNYWYLTKKGHEQIINIQRVTCLDGKGPRLVVWFWGSNEYHKLLEDVNGYFSNPIKGSDETRIKCRCCGDCIPERHHERCKEKSGKYLCVECLTTTHEIPNSDIRIPNELPSFIKSRKPNSATEIPIFFEQHKL